MLITRLGSILLLVAVGLVSTGSGCASWRRLLLESNKGADLPPPQHGAISWTDGTRHYMMGGVVGGNLYRNDTWSFRFGNFELLPIGNSVANGVEARGLGSAFYDSISNKGFILGGQGSQGILGDMWDVDVTARQWNLIHATAPYQTSTLSHAKRSSGSNPGERHSSMTWFDDEARVLYLFGGTGHGNLSTTQPGEMNDFWKYDVALATWTYLTGETDPQSCVADVGAVYPASRRGAAAWRDQSGALFMFGGFRCATYMNDMWVFKNNTWTLLSGANGINVGSNYFSTNTEPSTQYPPARGWSSVAWDPVSNRAFMYGGDGSLVTGGIGLLSDSWQYSPTEGWVFLGGSTTLDQDPIPYETTTGGYQTTFPPPRSQATAFFDRMTGFFYVFGGRTSQSNVTEDLWQCIIREISFCAGKRPSADFSCINGTWTAPTSTSVTVEVFNIGGSDIVITGNFSIGSASVINVQNLTNPVTVSQCLLIDGANLVLNLTAEELLLVQHSDSVPTVKPIFTYDAQNCPGMVSFASVNVLHNDECNSIEATTDTSQQPGASQTSIIVLFTVTPTGACSEAANGGAPLPTWAIAVIVVGVVVVVAGILAAFLLNPKIRGKIAPFSARTSNSAGTTTGQE